MSKIVIGELDGKHFVLARDTVTSTLVILGGKGMGKTNLGGVLVEELDAQGDRWCVIDPLGVWWGLRHSLDGKGPGIECVILGGPHGDIPIEPTGGAVAADLVVDELANVIIDISRKANGEMWSMGERIRFAKDFAKRLFQRQGELINGHRREPLFVELDEAATFIPQIIPSGGIDIAECVGAWQVLVEWGRNIGIGVGLLTQRSARINKSVTEIADALFSFRIVGPNSIKAVTDWLGEHVSKEKVKEHIETIRSLERGRCLVVSPGWMQFEGVVDVRLRHTFDSSATPKPGERQKRVTGKAAKPDLTKYQERMKETIERAKSEDPKQLRKQVAELKTKLTKAENAALKSAPTAKSGSAKADPNQARLLREMQSLLGETMKIIAKINAIGFDGADVKPEELQAALEKAVTEIAKVSAQKVAMKRRELEQLKTEVNRLITKLNAKLSDDKLQIAVDVVKNEPVTVRTAHPPSPAAARREPMTPSNGSAPAGNMSPGERAILIAAAQFGTIQREQLTVLTGYKRSSRDTYIQRLSSRGYVEVSGSGITIVQGGVDALGSDYEPLPEGEELQRYWLGRLSGGERSIFEFMLRSDGPVDREAISEATGYARSSRDTYLQRLSSRCLVESVGRAQVQLTANVRSENGAAA